MELVAGIQTAANQGDQRGLDSAIKKIAPKTTKIRMGFRDDKGAMMCADTEMQTLKKYVSPSDSLCMTSDAALLLEHVVENVCLL